MNPNFKTVALRKQTHKKLKFLSLVTGKSQAQIFEELLDPVFSLVATFDVSKSVGYWVDVSVEKAQIYITVFGKKRTLQVITSKVIEK